MLGPLCLTALVAVGLPDAGGGDESSDGAGAGAAADGEEKGADEHAFTFAAVPTATFNTDEGFGTGGVFSLYHNYQNIRPYRDELRLNFFISSKLVQAHALTWDGLEPLGLPGRAYVRVGYFSTVSQNYCGLGAAVDCARGDAVNAAEHAGLFDDKDVADDPYDEFVRHYHLMRFIRPFATVIFRPRLRDKPYRTELLLGWRGSYTYPGDVNHKGPYPGSRYAEDFPVGEEGFSSVPFVGVVVDDRDDEVFPTRGFFAEASVRGGHGVTGSTWPHAGGMVSGAVFVSMAKEPRLVLAARAIADVLVGAPSTEELARIGGTLDPIAFGGSAIGRGIREHRYLGKVKLLTQTELRGQFVDVRWLEQDLSFGAAVFSDAALIGIDVNDFGVVRPLFTAGISWRILWNQNFAIRWDLAVSPDENEGPGFYIIVGQAF